MAVERQRDAEPAPAFYAIRGGGWRDWWTILHPPYTVWHLSYVAIGVAAAPVVRFDRLAATLLAFFLAVGRCALRSPGGRSRRRRRSRWQAPSRSASSESRA
ncbi:MAG: hypothetical protein E6G46_11205 [Actinobacteria bacterium]|nr:MAG: hypothetical protein E6G46_11205 [Actinomycetota bacterium]